MTDELLQNPPDPDELSEHPDDTDNDNRRDYDPTDPADPTNARRRVLNLGIERFVHKRVQILDHRINHLWAEWRRDPKNTNFAQLYEELWNMKGVEEFYKSLIDFEVTLFQEYKRWLAENKKGK